MNEYLKDVCLQCGKSRTDVKDLHNSPCATATGYEYLETLDEWERHHWRDWSDAELKNAGIKSEAYEKYRRYSIYDLPWADCEDTVRGHMYPSEDTYLDGRLMHEKDVCMKCLKEVETDE